MYARLSTCQRIRQTRTRVGCQLFIVLTMACALPGCATQYKPMTWAGGFDDFRITEDTFEVTFRGNRHTLRETVSRYVFRRAAEVTLAHRFTHFTPTLEVDRTSFATVYQSAGYGGINACQPFLYESSGGYSSTIERPAVMMRIQCFNEPLPEVEGLIDAAAFLEYNYPEADEAGTRTDDPPHRGNEGS